MYVVIEFNQASYTPSVWSDTVYYDRAEAVQARNDARADLLASGSGRRERYAVAELTLDDGEE